MLLNCGAGEDSWESPWTARRSHLSILKEISLESSLEVLILKLKLQYFGHMMQKVDSLERPWCWKRLGAGREGDDGGWDGWMASPTRWMWVWVNSGSWWWTGRPGMLWFMGLQRVGHDWVTELTWTELNHCCVLTLCQAQKNWHEYWGHPLKLQILSYLWCSWNAGKKFFQTHRCLCHQKRCLVSCAE